MSKQIISNTAEKSSCGYDPYNRPFDELLRKGFIIADKEAGIHSHTVADNIKEILPVNKSGHSGTLDPQVTGVLLIGLEKTTKLMEYILTSGKEYICLCYFHKPISDKDLYSAIKAFTGEIDQLPPVVSAVKRKSRKRTIYELECLETQQDNQYALLRVSCQHGTYMRKLCTDMGQYLGVNAQMIELRRTKAGPIREEDGSIGLDKLRNIYELYCEAKKEDEKSIYEEELRHYIKPMEELVKDMKTVVIKDSSIESISHGGYLAIPGVISFSDTIMEDDTLALKSAKGELLAIGKSLVESSYMKNNEKGYCIAVVKVLI